MREGIAKKERKFTRSVGGRVGLVSVAVTSSDQARTSPDRTPSRDVSFGIGSVTSMAPATVQSNGARAMLVDLQVSPIDANADTT